MSLVLSTRKGLVSLDQEGPLVFQPNADFMALGCARSDRHRCYAARRDGEVFQSRNGGRSWDDVGAIGGFEELSSLAVDPTDPDHVLAGMEPAALYRSRDGGRSWEEDSGIRRMSGENGWSVPWSNAQGHIRSIAFDPMEPRRIYLAVEVGGIVRTEDGGKQWENVHGGIHDDVHSVGVNPADGAVVYAATRYGFGRSEDFGRTWTRTDRFEGAGYARPLAVDPTVAGRLFTAAAKVTPNDFDRPEGSECGIFRSLDGGRTWSHLVHGLPARFKPYVDSIDLDPANPDHVVLADADGHVFESVDGGDTWRAGPTLPPVRRLIFTA